MYARSGAGLFETLPGLETEPIRVFVELQLHLDYYLEERKKTHLWFKVLQAESLRHLNMDCQANRHGPPQPERIRESSVDFLRVMALGSGSSGSDDSECEDVPWKLVWSLQAIMVDAKLVGGSDGDGTKTGKDLVSKVYASYFSAHWCPPWCGSTPQLAKWYTDNFLKAKGPEVVFVSSDKDEAAFLEYFGEQPWLALDFADWKRKGQLSELFDVLGIPSVVLIDVDGSVVTKEARGAISADPTGGSFPWYPKPVRSLASGPSSINSVPAVFSYCETQDAAAHKVVGAVMAPIAQQYISKAKESKENEPAITFTIVTSSEGLAPRLRSMFSMPTLLPAVHEHPLGKQAPRGGWGCDGCGEGGGEARFRCASGYDFDYCQDCNTKAGKAVELLPMRLVLYDIPDEGGNYMGPELSDMQSCGAAFNKFLKDYSCTQKKSWRDASCPPNELFTIFTIYVSNYMLDLYSRLIYT